MTRNTVFAPIWTWSTIPTTAASTGNCFVSGVNRALEGLAIDVFNAMKDFGNDTGDPQVEGLNQRQLDQNYWHHAQRRGDVPNPPSDAPQAAPR